MGSSNADISRDIYNELLEYLYPVFQQGPNRPLVDADVNDFSKSLYRQIRRVLEIFGDGSPDVNGFLVKESLVSNINNFKILGGDGSLQPDTAGRIIVAGHLARIWYQEIEWNTTGSDAKAIHDVSTGLLPQKLTCSAANWQTNELAGRMLYPNTGVGTGFLITSNTQNEILISVGDLTSVASIGDNFRVDPSTPSSPRTDIVYLDVYFDEIDANEDTNLKHPMIGGSSFVSALRYQLKHVVRVREGSTTLPTQRYQDPDGLIHYYYKIATFTRDANNTITTAEITDEVNRDIYAIQAIRNEIIQARGTLPDLDSRLDVSLNDDGTVGNLTISDQNVTPTADIQQSKISESATYDDSYVGTPSDLEDDLNELRTVAKSILGEATYLTPPARDINTLDADLSSVETELLNARGSFPTGELDDRLDVSINEDGTLKPGSIYPAIPKLAAEQSMVFFPVNSSPYTTYRLHQWRGGFANKYPSGPRSGPYNDFGLDFNVGSVSYPIDVYFPGAYGPGGKDNDAGHLAGPQAAWYYVYLIGKATGELALVYSTAARPPWTVGPQLDNTNYDFPANGWIYWKFVAAVRNLSTSWELAQHRKIGNHVSYELAVQAVYNGNFGDSGWQTASMAAWVPPTAMRAEVRCYAEGKNNTNEMYVRPPSPTPPSGGIPGLHEIAVSPFVGYKLRASMFPITTDLLYWDDEVAWVDLNNQQEIGYRHIGAGIDHNGVVYVESYQEWTDFESTAPTW